MPTDLLEVTGEGDLTKFPVESHRPSKRKIESVAFILDSPLTIAISLNFRISPIHYSTMDYLLKFFPGLMSYYYDEEKTRIPVPLTLVEV